MRRTLLLVALTSAVAVGCARPSFAQRGSGNSGSVLWEERTIKSTGPATFDNRTHTEWIIDGSHDDKRACEDALERLILIYKHQPPQSSGIEGYRETRRVGPDRVVDTLYDAKASVHREFQSRYLCLPATLDPRPR